MIPVKTALGQQVLKDRSIKLTPRERAALILFDGKRSLEEVLQATAAAGICRGDVDCLFEQGLVAAQAAAAAPAAEEKAPAPSPTTRERYAVAYPIASQLAASLGLRGVRLSLAVEGATTFEDLVAVSARIREAVGREKLAPLKAALGQA
jgi:hypothetical protein